MLTLKMTSQEAGAIVFNYYPEGRSEYGTIRVNKDTGELSILHTASNDEFGTYKVHAIKRIKTYIQNKSFELEDTVAWY